jgi:bacterial/archaeal transporter family-2 protein
MRMQVQFWFYAAAAVLVGVLAALQPVLNAVLARAVGNPFGAGSISIAISLACSLLVVAFAGAGDLSRQALTGVPWWVYLAGIVGPIFVISGIVLAPAVGVLAFFMFVVAGQLLGATLLDHFGAFGLEVRPVSLTRLAGLTLVLLGALLVQGAGASR